MIFFSESRSFFLKVCKIYGVRIYTFWRNAGNHLHLADFSIYCSRAMAMEGALGVGA